MQVPFTKKLNGKQDVQIEADVHIRQLKEQLSQFLVIEL